MAPEQADPEAARLVDQRADIYSAAVVLQELLDGVEAVPPSLAAALDRARSPDPTDRYSSAWEWRTALMESLDEEHTPGFVPPGPVVRAQTSATTSVGTTGAAPTREHTLVVEQPTTPTRPDPIPGAAPKRPDRAIRLRPHGVAMLAAGLAMLVALFVPVSSARSLSGVSATSGSVSVTAAWIVAAAALVLLLAGLELWVAKRRWAARTAATFAFIAGLAGLAVATWVAVAVLTGSGETGPQAGVWVLAAAAGVGAVAASAASRRLRPPLAVTAPATGR
jgi:hypothetical protein